MTNHEVIAEAATALAHYSALEMTFIVRSAGVQVRD